MIIDMRGALRSLTLIAAAAGAGVLGLAVQAQDQTVQAPDQIAENYGDWSVRCVEREYFPPCDMVQVASDNRTGEEVMRLSIAHTGDAERYGLQIVVPLGVLFTGGVLVRVDGAKDITNLEFTRCDPAGCYVESLMDAEELDPFRHGREGVLAMLDAHGAPLVLPLSFRGFVAAMDAMSNRNREWAATTAIRTIEEHDNDDV